LTTSNMIYHDGKICLIDFGLGNVSRKVEDKATDLLLFKKSLNANHSKNFEKLWANTLKGYTNKENLERLEIAEKRGRYL
jgi:N6-L-threonylcarbamoyladenine synthase/protein kinase Bud32